MRIVTLDLLRHGKPAGGAIYRGRTDSPLTGEGYVQMNQTLAAQMGGWQRLYSSPLQRCAQFAQTYARQQRAVLQIDRRLREVDFGAWDGRTFSDVWQTEPERVAAFWQDPAQHPPPQGESMAALSQRVAAFMAEVTSATDLSDDANTAQDAVSCAPLLLITHGGVIRAMIAEVLGLPPRQWAKLQIDYGSLSRIQIGFDPQSATPWQTVAFINRLPAAPTEADD